MKDNDKATDREPKLLKQLATASHKLFAGSFRQQYAALCFRYDNEHGDLRILVVSSRESGRWVIPKGWPIKNKKPHEVASIEAHEEAGIQGKVKKKAIGRYTYLKSLDNGDVVPCIVDVFQLEASAVAEKFKEKGARAVAWVSPDEAARRVREVELKSLIIEFRPKT